MAPMCERTVRNEWVTKKESVLFKVMDGSVYYYIEAKLYTRAASAFGVNHRQAHQ